MSYLPYNSGLGRGAIVRTGLLLGALLASQAASAPVCAQGTVVMRGTPAEVGMSAGVLTGGVALYEEAVERGDLVGAVLLVAKDGKVVLHEAIGWRDKARGVPMEPNTLFRMASNTKPVVAAGVAMLVQDGRLAYNDLVREHMLEWDNYRSGFINIGHLLSHSSGLRIPTLFLQPYMDPSAEHPDAPTLQLEAARFGSVGPEVVPGTSYSYNNPGYNTLGALVEIASGMPMDEYLDAELYTPLGMHDSYHHEVDEKMDGKLDRMSVVYYQRDGEGDWTPGWTPGDPPQVPFVRASGGMISTAGDYVIFCQMFLNGGEYAGRRYLSEQTVSLMTTPKIRTNPGSDGPPSYYGYGWSVSEEGVYSHGGSDGTNAFVDPNQDLIVLVFTQTPGGRNPVRRFREIVNLAIGG
ncbi:MAG: beta-lactamase family protein [Gemmatimonadetes bacterium]|nr:serine hydrolase [Gemmatimonadota bacterium]MXX36237.1 beta-lactamase family protein [Gemmatimonadota bacterium]MYD14007.1 beta-lactamase family protein [Gemmatimonadota bacterium]MYI65661.1 beta-lactamase family protein [Gemmatimonadota bacterium]